MYFDVLGTTVDFRVTPVHSFRSLLTADIGKP